MDRTPEDRLNAEEVESVGCDADALETFRTFARGVENVLIADADHVRESVGLAAQFNELWGGVVATAAGLAALQIVNLDGKDARGVAVRERFQQYVLNDAEDGGGRTDSEAQGKNGHHDEAGLLAEAA